MEIIGSWVDIVICGWSLIISMEFWGKWVGLEIVLMTIWSDWWLADFYINFKFFEISFDNLEILYLDITTKIYQNMTNHPKIPAAAFKIFIQSKNHLHTFKPETRQLQIVSLLFIVSFSPLILKSYC